MMLQIYPKAMTALTASKTLAQLKKIPNITQNYLEILADTLSGYPSSGVLLSLRLGLGIAFEFTGLSLDNSRIA